MTFRKGFLQAVGVNKVAVRPAPDGVAERWKTAIYFSDDSQAQITRNPDAVNANTLMVNRRRFSPADDKYFRTVALSQEGLGYPVQVVPQTTCVGFFRDKFAS